MHLKSLTLKGFKSFASTTTLRFEPGVTAVVGPNGSGKSNVVDALTWVMGEQGAKALRGGKMEDVIFAGTTKRPALGRAEVSLTIDNTDGALPIDYSEVTISRIMFRSGGSEYAINGSSCRLLDVQELLSDSGIGREMHVIVGQGQLDSILHATPEDRRGFIEEAAGVLKHRRRKEKALRKLDGLTDKLDRLQDLSTELRRQLKPLGRQAEVARRAAVIQADLRDSKLRLLADDYVTAVATLEQGVADEEALLHRRSEQETALLAQRAREAALQAAAEAEAPELAALEDLENRLTRVSERLRGIATVAAERLLMIGRNAPSTFTGRDPQELRAQAQAATSQQAALAAQAEQHRNAAAAVVAARQSVEGDVAGERKRAADARAAIERAKAAVGAAARKESAAEAAVVARRAELQRAVEATQSAQRALGEISAEEQAPELWPESGTDVAGLKAAFEDAQRVRQDAAALTARLRTELGRHQQHESAERARAETLSASLAGLEANSGTVELSKQLPGVLGGVADVIRVEESGRRAVIAALGALADGLVVADLGTAATGLAALRDAGVDRAELVVAGGPAADHGIVPAGRALSDLIAPGGDAAQAVVRVLSGFVLVEDLAAAERLVSADSRWVAVTPEGDVLGRTWARGGVRDGSTRWEMHDALEQARAAQAHAAAAVEGAQTGLAEAQRQEALCDKSLEEARSRWQDGRAQQATDDERGRQWRRRVAAAQSAVASGQDRAAALERQLSRNLAEHESAVAALSQAEQQVAELAIPDAAHETELAARLEELRQAETEARLELRTIEERAAAVAAAARALTAEADELDKQAQRHRQEQERAARAGQVASVVVELAERAGAQAVADLESVAARRRALRERVAGRNSELHGLRLTIKQLEADVARLTDSVHADEVARTEQRLRVQQLAERALTDHGVDSAILVAEYGPDVLVPPSPVPPGDQEDGVADQAPYPYERKAQERRLRTAERSLSLLGAVNPLALEEFAALEERHAYLNEQIDDIKRTRADLLGIIKDVDARVEQVFVEAFADTAVQFERVFERLFPGGSGRLILTEPDDLLATGVEVEARPPGKKVKRLSLLSGGERSLTAVAFLIALFKARPSPFYVLDEVEAALDDTNLGRLIDVIDELRASSQLIVVTHQKRTMEAADALYGVSMRGDGVSHVISQRLAPAPVVDLTERAHEDV